MNPETLVGEVGKTYPIEVTTGPSNATDPSVRWKVIANPEVAEVDDNGNVTILSEGTATLQVQLVRQPAAKLTVIVTGNSGVESVTADEIDEYDVYNLQGVKLLERVSFKELCEQLEPGIYICRRGAKVKKVVIR